MTAPDATPLDPSGLPDPGRPRFCARCGAPMEEREQGGRRRPVCPRCGWVYYAKNALGAAVLIERDDRVLLVQRAHEPYQGWWMLPAGFVEYGEEAAACAVREAEEECALTVRLEGQFGVYFGQDDPRNPSYLIVYLARPEPPSATPRAGDDAAAVDWFPRGGLPAHIAFEGHRAALADWSRTQAGRAPRS
ncbi:MAG TPA: NUDIX domain-containing protein [Chloroflexota bacterium]|jgi:8-oxo-dGTP diphosphatase|nr:NUDIX domain-containing protein [Chloroflexota bacterium]